MEFNDKNEIHVTTLRLRCKVRRVKSLQLVVSFAWAIISDSNPSPSSISSLSLLSSLRRDNEPWRSRGAVMFIRWRNWHWSSLDGSLKRRVAVRGGGLGWHWTDPWWPMGRLRNILSRSYEPVYACESHCVCTCAGERQRMPTGWFKGCHMQHLPMQTHHSRLTIPTETHSSRGFSSLVIIYYKTAKRPGYL